MTGTFEKRLQNIETEVGSISQEIQKQDYLNDKIEYTHEQAKDLIKKELKEAKKIGKEVTAGTFIVDYKMKFKTFEKAYDELMKENVIEVK